MIMNISNNSSSSHHHSDHRNSNHHLYHHPHHRLHSNGSSSFLNDLLPSELVSDADHFRSRLTMLQDENALSSYRSPAGSYYPHSQDFSALNSSGTFSQSIVPAFEELFSPQSLQSSPHFGFSSKSLVSNSYYEHNHFHHPHHHQHQNEQQQQLLTGDDSPLPATSATSVALATTSSASLPPPTSALPSASSPKRPFLGSGVEYGSESAYHHQHNLQHHPQNEVTGTSKEGSCSSELQTNNSLKGSNMTSTLSPLKSGSITSITSIVRGVTGSKVPMADHNSQQSFSENICFGCRETLSTSRIIVSVSGYHNYHTSCLSCCECGQSLCQFPTCYIRHGRLYCKEDYAKLVKCSKCNRQIAADDWVRRAGELVYHLACFACDLCQRQLSTGENFTVVRQTTSDWRLLCKLHFMVKNENEEAKNRPDNCSPDVNLANPGDLSQTQTTVGTSGLVNDSSGAGNGGSGATNNNGTPSGALTPTAQRTTSSSSSSLSASSSKTKRVRTTFTEEQLSVLQANFQLDSNPDGQDLERIATLTGLSKRVTQVWFQNSRARQKKYMNKSHQRHSPGGSLLTTVGSGGPSANGVAMLLNGGGGSGQTTINGGLWSPDSSTGSSTGNDCLGTTNSQTLTLDCLNGAGSGGGGGSTGAGLSTPSKWAQSGNLNNNNLESTLSSQCTESEHSSSPHM